MLTVESPYCEILSSYQNPTKPIITSAVAKKHVHKIRLQRQHQLAVNINECHRLQTVHKQLYQRQFDGHSSDDKKPRPIKPTTSEHILPTRKYSIPRIHYAPIIYQQATPTFELKPLRESEKNVPIIKELTQFLSECPCAIANDHRKSNRSLLPIKHDRQRSLSVSSVTSIEKRTNRVYEKWPDYNRISEIVGYRINPPLAQLITSSATPARPSKTTNQQKRVKPTNISTISKPKKPSSRKPLKTVTPPVIVDEPTPPQILPPTPIKELKPTLPSLLCPSSLIYSHRIQTRQWLMKHNFSSNTIRTIPLL